MAGWRWWANNEEPRYTLSSIEELVSLIDDLTNKA